MTKTSNTDARITIGFRGAMLKAIDGLEGNGPYSNEQITAAINTAIDNDQQFLNTAELKNSAKSFFTDFVDKKDNDSLNKFIAATKQAAREISSKTQGMPAELLIEASSGNVMALFMDPNKSKHAPTLLDLKNDVEVFEKAGKQHLGINEMTEEIDKYFAQAQNKSKLQAPAPEAQPTETPATTAPASADATAPSTTASAPAAPASKPKENTTAPTQQPEQQQTNPFLQLIVMLMSAFFGIQPSSVAQQPTQEQGQQQATQPEKTAPMDKALADARNANVTAKAKPAPESNDNNVTAPPPNAPQQVAQVGNTPTR